VFDDASRARPDAEPIEVQIQLEACQCDLLAHVQASTLGRLARGDALSVARQLLGALAFLHANDVVHRDIKLQNVLVAAAAPQLVVKLSDLSLANTVAECAVWPSAGTICTKAPEGVRPHLLPIGEKSDVYSLGVTLFCAATGQFPFCAHTVAKGDGHKCPSECAELAASSSSDSDGNLRVEHVCVHGTIEDALAALEPPLALKPAFAALIAAMCQYDPANRPAASDCLLFEALHFRLRRQQQTPPTTAARGTKRVAEGDDDDNDKENVVIVLDSQQKKTKTTKTTKTTSEADKENVA
jgi:serine/threonine protein kinase